MSLIDQIIGVESGGNPTARNPNSSAMGAGQFINSTWLDVIKSTRPDLAAGRSDADLLALRSDPQLSREMTQAYAERNGQMLSQAGYEATPGNTYLAHFAGPRGAVSVLSADPGAPVSSILTPEAVKANPFLAGMTAGDLRAWADKKMGSKSPVPQPAQATAAPMPSATLSIPQGPPTFAPPAQQAAPQPPSEAPSFQDPSTLQIMFAKPRRVDLSALRASLQAPIFKRG